MSGIWQVVHVAEQLHQVAPQSRHDVRRIPASQAPHHPYGQSPHHPRLIIQCNKQGPQTAQTHRHIHQAQLQLWLLASVWLWRRLVSCSALRTAAKTPNPPIYTINFVTICSRTHMVVELLHAAALPEEYDRNCHAQTNLQHCHGLGALHATALLNEHHTLAIYLD